VFKDYEINGGILNCSAKWFKPDDEAEREFAIVLYAMDMKDISFV